jgi:hypothetical protein
MIFFISIINLYFCAFVSASSFYQGRLPRRKYSKIYLRFSKLFRRDCSISRSAISSLKTAEKFTYFKIIVDACEHRRAKKVRVREDTLRRSIWTILCGKIQIRDIDVISILSRIYQEVFGFDISMNHIFRINILKSADQLIRDH